ncbi:MAG: peptidoglycan bridge formation glycyltransferase FemA/FemB family protein, partial [Candidatus Margulisiibacteriota bacterium]
MNYYPVDDKDSWNKVAEVSGQVLQSYEWGCLKESFGWEPLRIKIDGSTGISILKRKLPFINKCVFYAPRGPAVDFKNKDKLKELIAAVKAEAGKSGALFLKIDPEIEDTDTVSLSNLKSLGFIRSGKEIQPRATIILDITKSEEEIMAGFESKFRYNIRLAEKKGVVVEEDISESAVEKYYGIYKVTSQRDSFMIHPISYYKKVRELIINSGMGTIFLAYIGKEPVAGVFIFAFGKRVWYMYGASSNEYRNCMPNNLIHWNVIKWAKERGYKEYDLWGIPANPTLNHPLWGVYKFKKGFNGKTHKFIGAYDLPFNRVQYKLFNTTLNGFQNLRSLIKKGKMADSLG